MCKIRGPQHFALQLPLDEYTVQRTNNKLWIKESICDLLKSNVSQRLRNCCKCWDFVYPQHEHRFWTVDPYVFDLTGKLKAKLSENEKNSEETLHDMQKNIFLQKLDRNSLCRNVSLKICKILISMRCVCNRMLLHDIWRTSPNSSAYCHQELIFRDCAI